MTAYSDLDSAVSAFQGGAFEYLPKPFDVPKAVELIRRAVDESLREEVRDERTAADARDARPGAGDAGRVPRHRPPVAEQRHGADHRRVAAPARSWSRARCTSTARAATGSKGPFVAINTAAIPKDLLETELFGHERGAFTGAQTMRRGRFEQADGGTLFLDEIGDMPFDLQTRLLRVLSDGQFYRVGGHSPLKSNVRVIAATHQNLEERVKQGAFREDLFHRLNVIRLRLPALRERREDIAGADALLPAEERARSSASRPSASPTRRWRAWRRFDFPGNVRQLENICHWLTVMAPAQVIEAEGPAARAARRRRAGAAPRRCRRAQPSRPHAAPLSRTGRRSPMRRPRDVAAPTPQRRPATPAAVARRPRARGARAARSPASPTCGTR